MIDCILRLPDAQMIEDRIALKKAVARLFGDRHDGERSRYLFSQEPRHGSGPWVRVRQLADELPSAAQGFVRKLPVVEWKVGDRVQATAWVALKGRVFSGTGELKPRVLGGLERVQARFVDALDVEDVDVGDRFEIAAMRRGKDRIGRAYGKVKVVGRVINDDALLNIMTTGIGAAKAYGFGLVDIQQLEDFGT